MNKFFFFPRSVQPIQASHRRLHRRHTCRFFLCCRICSHSRRIVPRTQRPSLRQLSGLDRLALHPPQRYLCVQMVGRFVSVQYGKGTGLLYLKLEQCYCQGERICENAGGLMIMNVRYLA